MGYLDDKRSVFIRLRAEHRREMDTGLSQIAHVSKAHRTVEVCNGKIFRQVSPFEAMLRRIFDNHLKHRDCGTFSKPASDPSLFLLDTSLVGMQIKNLPRVKPASSHRTIPA